MVWLDFFFLGGVVVSHSPLPRASNLLSRPVTQSKSQSAWWCAHQPGLHGAPEEQLYVSRDGKASYSTEKFEGLACFAYVQASLIGKEKMCF